MDASTLYVAPVPEPKVGRLLDSMGLDVQTAASLDEASLVMESHAGFDLVLTDAVRLYISPYQWGNWAWNVKAPIVVLVPSRADGQRFLEQGARDVLMWPGHLDQLALVVYRLVHMRPRRVNALVLSPLAREVRRYGESLRLTRLQYDLLQYLMAHAGRVVTYEELQREVWGNVAPAGDHSAVRMAVRRLRRLLGDEKAGVASIENVRGVGYRWVAPFSVMDGPN